MGTIPAKMATSAGSGSSSAGMTTAGAVVEAALRGISVRSGGIVIKIASRWRPRA